jgi:thioredoxin reductase (NADPH)
MLTTEVENFPGFPEGVLGPELMRQMRAQAERFGAEMVAAKAARAKVQAGGPHEVWYLDPSSGEEVAVETTALVAAMGARALMLGLPGETELIGHGLSTCATCDGFFFRGQEIGVVGGGDSAIEEALFLTRFATSVTVIHRRGELRASKVMQERAFANPKIRFAWNRVVIELLGNAKLEGVRTRSTTDGSEEVLPLSGLFVAIGHSPNSDVLRGQVDMDPDGYIATRDGTTATSVEGVFAAGDVVDRRYRQAVTAAGTGCMAAIDAERWLEHRS